MMKSNHWSWQQKDWPNFTYKTNEINALEQKFLEQMNFSYGVFKHLTKDQKTILKIDLLCDEAYKTSEIEGFKDGLSAKNYMTITKTSASTATRDLVDLVEKKIFTQTGERKTTRYWPNLNE